jgi:hypothetical protein
MRNIHEKGKHFILTGIWQRLRDALVNKDLF